MKQYLNLVQNILILIYLSIAIGLTPGGSTHLHINNIWNITINNKTTRITKKTTQITNLEECWPCPVFANYTLARLSVMHKGKGGTAPHILTTGNCLSRFRWKQRHQTANVILRITLYFLIYLSTAIGLTPGGSTHLHINNIWNITINNKTTRITKKTTQITNLEECWPCPVFANYTLARLSVMRKGKGGTAPHILTTGNCMSRYRWQQRHQTANVILRITLYFFNIFVNCNWVDSRWQYIFTHKQ
jgi:hypothetical protein